MLDLPQWIDREAWDGYIEMRSKIKKPLTRRGMKLAIGKLFELRAQGYDSTEVLDQSTFNCWQGLFPIRKETERESFEERRQRKSQEVLSGVDQVLQDMDKAARIKPSNQGTACRLLGSPSRLVS